jgi:hypothetical protein
MKTTVVHVNSPEWAQAVKEGRALYIGRAVPRRGFKASKWGNLYRVGDPDCKTPQDAVNLFRTQMHNRLKNFPWCWEDLPTLRGKVLGCWCKQKGDEPCHGDVLAELVNREASEHV